MNVIKIIMSVVLASIIGNVNAQKMIKMVVGTYTSENSKGIYSFNFNQDTGVASILDSLSMINPSYLTISSNGKRIYAVSETNDKNASVNTIAFDSQNGNMQFINTNLTDGEDPCFVETNGEVLTSANYTGGSMSVFPIDENGNIKHMTQLFHGDIGGPDKQRQETPHIHCTRVTPNGKSIIATDFSSDRLLQFDFIDDFALKKPTVLANLSKSTGPRHFIFSHNEDYLYVFGELSGNVTVLQIIDGKYKIIQEIKSETIESHGGADIHLSPNGKFLYTSNRLKNDGITIFKVNNENGKLIKVGYQLTGIHPRNFNITPNGRFLLCACRDSNIIQIYKIDENSGFLSDTKLDIHISKPVCIQFYSPNIDNK